MSDKHHEVNNTPEPVDSHERRAVTRMSDDAHQSRAAENIVGQLSPDSPFKNLVANARQPEGHPEGTPGFYKDFDKFNNAVMKAVTDGASVGQLTELSKINDFMTTAMLDRTENLARRFANAQMHHEGALQV